VSQATLAESRVKNRFPVCDLRNLIECLQSEGRLLHMSRNVLPEPDVQAFCRAASELGGSSLLFDRITGYEGSRLALNLLASWGNCALMCGLPVDTTVREIVEELCFRANHSQCKPTWIEREDSPSYECMETNAADLYAVLPLFRVNPHDGGYYLHKACVVSKDPSAGVGRDRMKFGMYSLQVQGRDRLGVDLAGTDDLSLHLRNAERVNHPLRVAVCLGVPPLAALVASAAIGYERTEYDLISALYDRPFELTRCLQSNLSVPVYSEFVLEGHIEPGLRCPEGPFTCDGGGFSEIKRQPQIIVTAIAHRKNPVLDNTYVGKSWAERDCMVGLASTLRLHKQARDFLPEIARSGTRAQGVHLRLGFCGGHLDGKRCADGIAFQDVLPAESELSGYKQEIREVRRRQAQCHSRT